MFDLWNPGKILSGKYVEIYDIDKPFNFPGFVSGEKGTFFQFNKI
jgi:hypothetical protein